MLKLLLLCCYCQIHHYRTVTRFNEATLMKDTVRRDLCSECSLRWSNHVLCWAARYSHRYLTVSQQVRQLCRPTQLKWMYLHPSREGGVHWELKGLQLRYPGRKFRATQTAPVRKTDDLLCRALTGQMCSVFLHSCLFPRQQKSQTYLLTGLHGLYTP